MRALADMISARKVISLITPDNAYYQVPADIADNTLTDNTTLPQALEQDELSFARGESMTIYSSPEEGWHEAEVRRSQNETLIIYKLSSRKFTTHNDLY